MLSKVLRSPISTIVLFVIAAVLLIGGSIGAVQAAPRIQSADYRAEVVLSNIETSLTENGTIVEGTDALLREGFATYGDNASKGLGWNADKKAVTGFKIGTTYDESLAVRNVGTIPQYVRVTVNKYWVATDAEGNVLKDSNGNEVKVPELDPKYIDLHFVTGNGWTIDEDASTDERTVLYYKTSDADGILGEKGSDTTDSTPFADKLTISSDVARAATLSDSGLTYDYDGVMFRIKAEVDAVQTHNSEPAMTAVWGRTN